MKKQVNMKICAWGALLISTNFRNSKIGLFPSDFDHGAYKESHSFLKENFLSWGSVQKITSSHFFLLIIIQNLNHNKVEVFLRRETMSNWLFSHFFFLLFLVFGIIVVVFFSQTEAFEVMKYYSNGKAGTVIILIWSYYMNF